MSVRVDSLSTEVVAEASPAAGSERAREGMEWEEQARLSARRLRLARDEERTAARGFDD